jgi:predicted transcriptional regulator
LATELELAEEKLRKTRYLNKRAYRTRIQMVYLILKHIMQNRVENQVNNKHFLYGHNVCGVTSIMQGLQTSSQQFKRYLEFSEKTGLLTKEEFKTRRKSDKRKLYCYKITDKGVQFVDYIDRLMELVNENDKNNKDNFLFPVYEDL